MLLHSRTRPTQMARSVMSMFRRSLLPVLAMTALVVAFVARAETADMSKPEFAPGQMWSIKSTTPTTTKVIIGRVEEWSGKIAIHVSVIDAPIPPGVPGAGGITNVGHMPFDQSALVASVDQLLATGVSPAPNFEAGYAQWKSAKGGIYTISVTEAVGLIFETLLQRRT